MDNKQPTILVVDDEEQIIEVIKAYLEKEDFKVFTSYTGKEALEIFEKTSIDFIILDLMLPDYSGEDICKKIRLKSQVPIIMLTAKIEEGDRINGLSIGADDYVLKPFSPKELIARVKAILRRTKGEGIKAEIIEFNEGHLIIDLASLEVKQKGVNISLSPTEFKLLSLLAKNPSKVFSREEIITKVLGFDYDGYDRTIDVHIKNIRHKIEDQSTSYIKTVYGIGYKFLGD